MKTVKKVCLIAAGVVVVAGIVWGICGKKVKMLYTSLNSFKDENLAHTFQHTPEIQPTKKISAGESLSSFYRRTMSGSRRDFRMRMPIIRQRTL